MSHHRICSFKCSLFGLIAIILYFVDRTLAQLESYVPDEDYPIYTEVPLGLSFTCDDKIPGYYADPEARCQVWHWCVPGIGGNEKYSFICAPGTVFNQRTRVCDYFYKVDCPNAPAFYGINEDLYKDEAGNYINGKKNKQRRSWSKESRGNSLKKVRLDQNRLVDEKRPFDKKRPIDFKISLRGRTREAKIVLSESDLHNKNVSEKGFINQKPLIRPIKKQIFVRKNDFLAQSIVPLPTNKLVDQKRLNRPQKINNSRQNIDKKVPFDVKKSGNNKEPRDENKPVGENRLVNEKSPDNESNQVNKHEVGKIDSAEVSKKVPVTERPFDESVPVAEKSNNDNIDRTHLFINNTGSLIQTDI